MAHQSARASSTGGQGGQLHLVAVLQPPQLSGGQSRSGRVLAGEGGSLRCHPPGEVAPERPRSLRRGPQTQSGASQLVCPGVDCRAASSGEEVPRGCRSLASPGGSFVLSPFWPQCAAQASHHPEPGQLARYRVHPGEDAKEERLVRGGGEVVLPQPPACRGVGGTPKVRVARRVRAASC